MRSAARGRKDWHPQIANDAFANDAVLNQAGCMKSAGQSLPDSMLQNFSTNQRMERIGLCHINRAAQ